MIREPAPGEWWRHKNGNLYKVLLLTNLPDEPRYPKTVVYQTVVTGQGDGCVYRKDGPIWSRRFDDWHRSFTYVGYDQPIERTNHA